MSLSRRTLSSVIVSALLFSTTTAYGTGREVRVKDLAKACTGLLTYLEGNGETDPKVIEVLKLFHDRIAAIEQKLESNTRSSTPHRPEIHSSQQVSDPSGELNKTFVQYVREAVAQPVSTKESSMFFFRDYSRAGIRIKLLSVKLRQSQKNLVIGAIRLGLGLLGQPNESASRGQFVQQIGSVPRRQNLAAATETSYRLPPDLHSALQLQVSSQLGQGMKTAFIAASLHLVSDLNEIPREASTDSTGAGAD